MGEPKIDQKMTFLLSSNFETIEGMDLKLMMLYYLFRHYAQTKFHSILKGSRFFCVDLTWNDPIVRREKGELLPCHDNRSLSNTKSAG